jgi:4-amino-4-deoxy-L-arabinose transferase-like glycosyltransferase
MAQVDRSIPQRVLYAGVTDRSARLLLAFIVGLYLFVGALYVVFTPPWQAPDEPAHYNYVAQIVERGGCCPVVAPGDWDLPVLEALWATQTPPDAALLLIEYEDHQPPLYYLIVAFVYALTGGSLTALRLVSVALGAGVVVAAYIVAERLFPEQRPLALGAAAIVGFIPQHVAMLASVNNDPLAELVIGWLLAAAIAYLGLPARGDPSRPPAALLGLLLGAAFVTKLTAYGPALVAVGGAIALRAWIERHPPGWAAGQALRAGAVGAALGAPWWIRNAVVYGWPDVLAQRAHQAVVVGQLHTGEYIALIGVRPYFAHLLTTTYHSFWGQFGWMTVPMSGPVYLLIGLYLLGVAAGWFIGLYALRRTRAIRPVRWAGVWLLAAVVIITLIQYGYYNVTFVQFQGRYLFPALIPLALLMAFGAWGWAWLLARRLPVRAGRALAWLPLAGVAWLPPLAVYALFRFVIPFLG